MTDAVAALMIEGTSSADPEVRRAVRFLREAAALWGELVGEPPESPDVPPALRHLLHLVENDVLARLVFEQLVARTRGTEPT